MNRDGGSSDSIEAIGCRYVIAVWKRWLGVVRRVGMLTGVTELAEDTETGSMSLRCHLTRHNVAGYIE